MKLLDGKKQKVPTIIDNMKPLFYFHVGAKKKLSKRIHFHQQRLTEYQDDPQHKKRNSDTSELEQSNFMVNSPSSNDTGKWPSQQTPDRKHKICD